LDITTFIRNSASIYAKESIATKNLGII